MRTAIWAAVSTVSQATPDKVSIQVQLQKGREFIETRHHTPAGEYIVPGESRTKYISLYHAEKEIAPLHALLEAAARKEFDLLFIYDLNRFRTLMRQIFDAPTLTERLKSVQNQIDTVNAQLTKQRASQTRRDSSSHTRARLAQILDTLESYYQKAPPAQVNADLHDIIEHIQISKAHKIKIKWRGEE